MDLYSLQLDKLLLDKADGERRWNLMAKSNLTAHRVSRTCSVAVAHCSQQDS